MILFCYVRSGRLKRVGGDVIDKIRRRKKETRRQTEPLPLGKGKRQKSELETLRQLHGYYVVHSRGTKKEGQITKTGTWKET